MQSNYFQVDEDSFIPIINIGSSTYYKIKRPKRPDEVYLRLTYDSLRDALSTDEKEKRFLKWLIQGVLPSLNIKEEGESNG